MRKHLFSATAFVMAFVMVFALLPQSVTVSAAFGDDERVFDDVPVNHWAADAIAQAVSAGYVNGYTDGTFKPNQEVTREEFISMVARALDVDLTGYTGIIWSMPALKAAVALGWIEADQYSRDNETQTQYTDMQRGAATSLMELNGEMINVHATTANFPMTRLEMAKVAVLATGVAEDAESADEIMYAAVKNGIIAGTGKGDLAPNDTTTRAQAVVVIERMLLLINGGALTIDEQAVKVADIEYSIATGDVWDKTTDLKRVRPEIARYYEMRIHESFQVENGHLKGYLPELPEGLEYGLSFYVEYDPKDKVTASNVKYLNYDVELIPGKSFSLPILEEDKVQRMLLHVSVMVSETGSKRRYSNMDYYNDREITEYVKY